MHLHCIHSSNKSENSLITQLLQPRSRSASDLKMLANRLLVELILFLHLFKFTKNLCLQVSVFAVYFPHWPSTHSSPCVLYKPICSVLLFEWQHKKAQNLCGSLPILNVQNYLEDEIDVCRESLHPVEAGYQGNRQESIIIHLSSQEKVPFKVFWAEVVLTGGGAREHKNIFIPLKHSNIRFTVKLKRKA